MAVLHEGPTAKLNRPGLLERYLGGLSVLMS